MSVRRSPVSTLVFVAAACAALVAQPQRPPDQFVSVNGVRLHYLDWGGSGPALVFLAGLGDSVHRFDDRALHRRH